MPPTSPRIFLFGTGDTGHAALSYLIKENANVVGVCTNTVRPRTSFIFQMKVFLVQTLFDLGLYQPHDQILHNFNMKTPDNAKLAQQKNIDCYDIGMLNQQSFLENCTKLNPDLILCFGFPKLLPKSILDIAKISAINIHPGFLPQRGGGTPVRWAIFLGDKKIGLTAHIMTIKFDSGKIIAERSVPILNNDDSKSAERKIIKLFPDLMKDILGLLAEGKLEKDIKNLESPQILPPMRKNHNQINWQKHSAEDIKKITLAMRPKGSAYSFFKNRQLYFWDISILEKVKTNALPGTVIDIEKNGDLVIKTIDGCIRVHSFLFGYKIRSSKFMCWRLNLKPKMFFSYKEQIN